MNEEEKKKLLDFLFPSDKAREFVCNHVFEEIKKALPIVVCIGSRNIVNSVREINLNYAKEKVSKIVNSETFRRLLKILFGESEDLAEDILIAYVFYLSETSQRCRGIDIFRDKRSILYSEIPLTSIL